MARIARLSWADLNNLAIEAPDTPMHQMVLATLDREPLLESRGRLRLDEVRAHVAARLERVPELRRILYRPGLFQGRPLWVDDPHFYIDEHVVAATLPPPGGDPAVLELAGVQMSLLMDRSRPLWRLWLLDGYGPSRLGLLIKLHHALADGPAMINMLAQVFDLEPRECERPTSDFTPVPAPSARELRGESISLKEEAAARAARRLRHPHAALRSAAANFSAVVEALRNGHGAPRSSLNRPVGGYRKVAAVHVSLAEVKAVAHRHGATVNDVFLCLVAFGLRQVLMARGEPVAGRSVRASVAVSLRHGDPSMSGNHVGTVIVPLPLDVASPDELIAAAMAATARAKTRQLAVGSTSLMVLLARLGITRAYIRRQHMITVLTTNLPGPPMPLFFAGACVYDAVALPPIAGNVTVSFAALSYAGGLNFSVVADADAWPDLDLLAGAMADALTELARAS